MLICKYTGAPMPLNGGKYENKYKIQVQIQTLHICTKQQVKGMTD